MTSRQVDIISVLGIGQYDNFEMQFEYKIPAKWLSEGNENIASLQSELEVMGRCIHTTLVQKKEAENPLTKKTDPACMPSSLTYNGMQGIAIEHRGRSTS